MQFMDSLVHRSQTELLGTGRHLILTFRHCTHASLLPEDTVSRIPWLPFEGLSLALWALVGRSRGEKSPSPVLLSFESLVSVATVLDWTQRVTGVIAPMRNVRRIVAGGLHFIGSWKPR